MPAKATELKRERRQACRYFRGIQFDTCKAGVAMESVRRPLPCLPLAPDRPAPDTCPKREWMTDEDHEARDREFAAAVERLRKLGEQGLCHVCEKPIEPSRIVGKCKYGACGHRIGQVR